MGNDLMVGGRFTEADAANERLAQMGERVHLMSPVPRLESVPEFHDVAIRLVAIKPQPADGEVYESRDRKGELALTKVGLDRLAAAAGISWVPERSGRVDDRSDPHYCEFAVTGVLRDVDGTTRTLTGTKAIDLRDGSADAVRMNAGELARQRQHIVALAESKAKNRAVRSLGVRQSYRPDELKKPFAVVAVVFSGRSPDPELERLGKLALLDRSNAAAGALYGAVPRRERGEPPLASLPPPPLPPLKEVDGDPVDVPTEPDPPEETPGTPPASPAAPTPEPGKDDGGDWY